jgi:hypothetical protein
VTVAHTGCSRLRRASSRSQGIDGTEERSGCGPEVARPQYFVPVRIRAWPAGILTKAAINDTIRRIIKGFFGKVLRPNVFRSRQGSDVTLF